jgi:hypothetical protein
MICSPDVHSEDVLRDGDVMPRLAQKVVGFCRRSHRRLLVCDEDDQQITASHTSHTIMSAQAVAKAPFRLGAKEVFLYVYPSRARAFSETWQPTKSTDDHETDPTSL